MNTSSLLRRRAFDPSEAGSSTVTEPASDANPHRHVWRTVAMFVVPYLLLGVAWAFANPPGAAPDEQDHLVKALGSASFHIGEAGPPAPADAPLAQQRNASIARSYEIPARLVPAGYSCFAFVPETSAACLPQDPPDASGAVVVLTPVGAYPPFLYVPIGLVAGLASTPDGAFVLARLVVLTMSTLLLALASTHLVRWLGRGALLGLTVLFTPMAVYTMAIVSLSAIELCAATVVAAVVVVALRRPESLAVPVTMWTLAVGGVVLALSRQLGAVTLVALLGVLVLGVGWRRCVDVGRERTKAAVLTLVALVLAILLVAWWELTYDKPTQLGTVFSFDAVQGFADSFYGLLTSAIGNFGWLDTPLPDVAIAAWVVVWVLVLGIGLLVTRGVVFRSLAIMLGLTIVVAYAIDATVFHSIGAAAQGRHFLPIFALCPLLGTDVVVRHTAGLDRFVGRRVFVVVALLVGVAQALAVYWNGRRYATGVDGSIFFLGEAEWTPPLGWVPWLLLSTAASVYLAVTIVRLRSGVSAAPPT